MVPDPAGNQVAAPHTGPLCLARAAESDVGPQPGKPKWVNVRTSPEENQAMMHLKRFVTASSVAGLVLFGCSCQPATSVPKITAQEQRQRSEIGKGMEQSGVIAEKDYVRLRGVIDGIRHNGSISDRDLDWSLALLKQSSEPLARSRILTGLSTLKRCSASQKAKILAALPPYVNSPNPLDSTAANRVQRAMQGV
jgi:hypothetical protein